MESYIVYEIAGIGLVTSICNFLFTRSGHDDHAMIVTMAGLIASAALVFYNIHLLINLLMHLFF